MPYFFLEGVTLVIECAHQQSTNNFTLSHGKNYSLVIMLRMILVEYFSSFLSFYSLKTVLQMDVTSLSHIFSQPPVNK